jgi:NAD(P)-dependent dehydrogenase (short-subunit alcohol dehydrogenase family)
MMETNVYGLLRVSQAFAPVLAANGGGALLNVLSVASWLSAPVLAAYAVSKAAAWSATNGLRNELRAQGTQVLGLHVGFIDTDLTRGFEAPKLAPDFVVARAFEALEAATAKWRSTNWTQQIKRGLSNEPGIYIDAALNRGAAMTTIPSPLPRLPRPVPPAHASPWPTFWIACIAVFLVSIDSTVLFAAFGALQRAFPAATPADLSWVLNAYTVVYATMLIPAGGLADAHGRKRVFLPG